MPTRLGHVVELWRYPVKSLGGEALEEVRCDRRGVEGDRRFAVRGADAKIGSGKTTRRFRRMPGLLSLGARTEADGAVSVGFPAGERCRVGDVRCAELVGAVVGEAVTLAEEEPGESYFDACPLHLVSLSSLSWLRDHRIDDRIDRRRFRPNLLVDTGGSGRPEDGWPGLRATVGSATVRFERPTERCVMVTMRQPDLPFAPGILRELERRTDGRFGVYASVEAPGTIRVGDELILAHD